MSDIQAAANLIRAARAVAVLTGAGVSKESGVPTFRDTQEGLWANYDPTELATPQAFQQNPKRVWEWYEYRRKKVADVDPNPGHRALVALEAHAETFTLITQNVDNLHEQAGSTDVIHLHGNIGGHRCFHDCQGTPTRIPLEQVDVETDDGPPDCPYCGQPSVRADVVWFGEMLPQDELSRAATAAQTCDVMLVVGTSGLVTPAANLPPTARKSGASYY